MTDGVIFQRPKALKFKVQRKPGGSLGFGNFDLNSYQFEKKKAVPTGNDLLL
jgi:hypothetical protein